MAGLRILQFDWLRAFWLITQEPEVIQTWDLCRQKANNMNFHLVTKPEKSDNKFFGKTLLITLVLHG